jgi:hypothetical protein
LPYANTSGFDFFEVLSSFSGKTKKNDFHDWYPLLQGDDPACLREFLLPILCRNSPSGNIGLQMLDRQWGAGWNLLALLLATKPDKRIR